MLLENQHPHNKSIMIAVLGRPNAGKSSLINHLIGFDLSIVSPRPQTTRNTFHCSFVKERTEVIFVDTPGIHESSQELNIRMNGQAQMASDGGDINWILVDSSTIYHQRDNEQLISSLIEDTQNLVKEIGRELGPSWLLFTKSDQSNLTTEQFAKIFATLKAQLPMLEQFFVISTEYARQNEQMLSLAVSKKNDGLSHLIDAVMKAALPGAHHYPDGSVSNKNMRFFAAEYIREQAFKYLKDELPYEMAVVIDEFTEKKVLEDQEEFSPGKAKIEASISASILVNRPSQRAIVVGKGGSVIKAIGTDAREKIEAMMGSRVFLNLHVKVSPKWFKNNYVLDEIGLPRVEKSHRVWRAR